MAASTASTASLSVNADSVRFLSLQDAVHEMVEECSQQGRSGHFEMTDTMLMLHQWVTDSITLWHELMRVYDNLLKEQSQNVCGVLVLINCWTNQHPDQFIDQKELLDLFSAFVSTINSSKNAPLADLPKDYTALVSQLQLSENQFSQAVSTSTANLRNNSRLLSHLGSESSLSAESSGTPTGSKTSLTSSSLTSQFIEKSTAELANNLTALQLEIFKSIRPSYLKSLMGSGSKRNSAPSTTDLIAAGNERIHSPVAQSVRFFNQVAFWVVQMILNEPVLKDRSETLAKFIKIAARLRALHNYNTLFAVYSGLTHNAVYRLSHTFAALPKRYQVSWSLLVSFLSPDGNFSRYRQEIRDNQGSSIPYMGLVLSDLIHIQDAYRNRTPPNSSATINITRLCAQANILRLAFQAQNTFTVGPVDNGLLKILQVALRPVVSETEMDALSLLREPRTGTGRTADHGTIGRNNVLSQTFITETVANLYGMSPNKLSLGSLLQSESFNSSEDAKLDVQELVDAIFEQYDTDHNNTLSKEEFTNLSSFFPFLYSFNTLDADSDGVISREELLQFFLQIRAPENLGQLHKFFQHSIMPPGSLRCELCSKVMWTSLITGSYFRCITCGTACHRHCRSSIDSKCTPASEPGKLLTGFRDKLFGSLSSVSPSAQNTSSNLDSQSLATLNSSSTSLAITPIDVNLSKIATSVSKTMEKKHRRVKSEDFRPPPHLSSSKSLELNQELNQTTALQERLLQEREILRRLQVSVSSLSGEEAVELTSQIATLIQENYNALQNLRPPT